MEGEQEGGEGSKAAEERTKELGKSGKKEITPISKTGSKMEGWGK